jgi:hypothetical protein
MCLEKADAEKAKPKLVTLSDGTTETVAPAWGILDKHVCLVPLFLFHDLGAFF